jgi:hypothetical protein
MGFGLVFWEPLGKITGKLPELLRISVEVAGMLGLRMIRCRQGAWDV